MFTWICPQCGREVSPSYSECPDCTAKAQAAPPASVPAGPPAAGQPTQPQMQAPPAPQGPPPAQGAPPQGQYAQPVYPQPVQQYYQQPPPGYPMPPPGYYPPPPRRSNTWLVTIIVALGLTAAGAAAYYFLPSTRAQRASEDPDIEMEAPAQGTSAASARLAKNLEIAGLRIVEERKKPVLKFLVVNHSGSEVSDLKGSIALHASNAAAGSEPISVIKLQVDSIGAHESKEVSAPIKTSLRAYELPDWQFLKADLQVTSQ